MYDLNASALRAGWRSKCDTESESRARTWLESGGGGAPSGTYVRGTMYEVRFECQRATRGVAEQVRSGI